MSEYASPHNLMQPLSIGNVINLGVYLYRTHLKLYFQQALIAHLWLLVPIYGWAKFYAISGLISRLAFCELIGEPETLKAAKTHINRQLWNFLFTGILVLIIPVIEMLVLLILVSISAGFLVVFFQSVLGFSKFGIPPGIMNSIYYQTIFYLLIFLVVYILIPLWFYSSLFLTDLPLAVNSRTNTFGSINQSGRLSKSLKMRMILIILVSFLITSPLIILSWIVCSFLLGGFFQILSQFIFTDLLNNDSFVGTTFLIILSLINGVLWMPFWQSVKAVVYYDTRCRKEGFDLVLNSRNT